MSYSLVFLACLIWLQIVFASNENLLPLPREINWQSTSPRYISRAIEVEIESSLDTSVLDRAFARTLKTVFDLEFYPPVADSSLTNNTGIIPNAELSVAANSAYNTSVVIEESPISGNTSEEGDTLIDMVFVTILDDADLQLGVDESYTMSIGSNVSIVANTTWGALHAFKSLQQLIVYKDEKFYVEGSVTIRDSPLFPHRGIMIDTARNFIPLADLKKQISIMSLSKLNVLHLHLTDTQSWPIEVKGYPDMTKDAYSRRDVYTVQDVLELIDFARDRGVRLVPEVDMPGHSRAGWRQVDPRIVTCGETFWNGNGTACGTAVEPGPGQLDILNNNTYNVVKNVYDELSNIFPDNVFHAGMDELNEGCYKVGNDTNAFLESHTLNELAQYWLDRVLPILNKNRLTMWADILVSEMAVKNLPKDIILQSWLGADGEAQNITSQGYDVILSPQNFLYLDCGSGGFVANDPRYVETQENKEFNYGLGGSWCGPYKTWQRIYDWDILANLTADEAKHVLGAEAAVWTESIDNTVLTSIIWPRTASLAELLWSGNRDPATGYLRTYSLLARIVNFRQYLVGLNYEARPLIPQYCFADVHACDLFPQPGELDQFGTFFF
jgi:hexosaminidase